ncbi:MAG: bifunctional diguanylate cyclase/phosphodiesterase [Actinobacteria bacterium]|nr:bifunctional diguanylate cyclase/phosphodiesterase [Actinomycetota bacterium]
METTGWGGLRRFGAYALVTLVPVVWLGFVLTHTFRTEIERDAIQEARAHAATVSAAALEPFLRGQPFSLGLTSDERVDIARTTSTLLERGTVLQLRLRTNDGQIVFDAADPAAGPGDAIIDPEVQEAVELGSLVALTTVGSDAVDGKQVDGAPAVEAYIALYAVGQPDRVVGVAEMYLPYAPIAEGQQHTLNRLLFTIVVGLAILWMVLAALVLSVARRVRRHSEQAERVALHDQLTGLPGRAIYADRVDAALAAAGRLGTDVALVVIDIDRFKEVNDTLGHRNGDALLRIVAERLTAALRPGDTVARLGGDEFGVILPGVRSDSVEAILRRLQDYLAQEAELGGVVVSVEASMGYAMWPCDADHADSLVQRADLALYAAKTARAAIVRYHPGVDEFDPKRLGLIAELRRAIGADELVLHYQPKVEAATGRVVAFEALVRWVHPTRGMVPPNDFIPIAESTGLISPLTHWVVDTALTQLAEWSRSYPELSMAVNISARNLRDDLPGWIMNRLAAHGVRADQLVLEITETSFATDPVRATALLEELNAAGVKVSLDDFGQGYTSLGSLGHLPVSELKIDRGFVLAMETSPEDRAIVASVIELGHQLGLTVVAEGVETEAARDDLLGLGCDTMQGYLFSRPLPAAQALGLLGTAPLRV